MDYRLWREDSEMYVETQRPTARSTSPLAEPRHQLVISKLLDSYRLVEPPGNGEQALGPVRPQGG